MKRWLKSNREGEWREVEPGLSIQTPLGARRERDRQVENETLLRLEGHPLLGREPAGSVAEWPCESVEDAWYRLWDYVGNAEPSSSTPPKSWGDGWSDGISKIRELMIKLSPPS